MDDPNTSINSLSFFLERLHLDNLNTFGEHGHRIGAPSISTAWSHPQLLPLASMSQEDLKHLVLPFRPSHALPGLSSGLPYALMDRSPAFESSRSLNCSSSIRAPEQRVLPAITEDYLHLGFVSDDPPSTNYPIEESSSLLASDNFSNACHLNPSALNTQEALSDVGDVEQRGFNFYRNNLGTIAAPGSPYISTPLSINPAWSSGSSDTLFDGSEASSSQRDQGGCCSGITGRCFSSGRSPREVRHHTGELNSVSGDPFLNTLSGRPGFSKVEAVRKKISLREEVRDLAMKGPVNPVRAMRKKVLPHLLSLLDDGDTVILENILNGVLHSPSLYRVMKDKHGHHLFRKLLDKCNYMHKLAIVSLVTRKDELLGLAKDRHGNCSVKKIIASVKGSPELCYYVTSALRLIISDLMNHPLGLSLIDCCLEHLTYDQNSFIFEEARRKCHQLARQKKGVFTLKLCIEQSDRPHRLQIVEELVWDTIGLAQDAYGNFAIQFVLDLKDSDFTEMICSEVAEHLAELSLHKTGSYVAEGCLESSKGGLLLRKLENFTDEVLEEISTHPFGNYVLQKALKVEKETRGHHNLAGRINQILRNLRNSPYATNVLKHAR